MIFLLAQVPDAAESLPAGIWGPERAGPGSVGLSNSAYCGGWLRHRFIAAAMTGHGFIWRIAARALSKVDARTNHIVIGAMAGFPAFVHRAQHNGAGDAWCPS